MKTNPLKSQESPEKPQGNWWLIIIVLALTVFPLIFIKGEYNGADGEIEEVITEIKPSYQPWLQPMLKPVSKEVESLLFSTQAALGAGIIGYIIGYYRGKV